MTRAFFTFCFLFCFATSFGQKRDALLFKAYQTKSLTKLKAFFDNWARETKPIKKLSGLNDTVKNVYLVFQAFYNPKDIARIGGSEWGNDIYKKAQYLLVQDVIFYGIVDTLLRASSDSLSDNDVFEIAKHYDSLKDFRPQLVFRNAKTVVLTKAYDSLLNRFLGNEGSRLAKGNVMSTASPEGESEKRKQFLENYIKIWYGHWGGYWQLLSYPSAFRITFDKEFEHAIIDYHIVYEGGFAYLKNINGKWTLLKAKRNWIE
jgi:hypothetical protein